MSLGFHVLKEYQDLLRYVLENGEEHNDRNRVGTLSVFGYQTRFDLRETFPLLTTKKVPFRWGRGVAAFTDKSKA
jgi:thymidylate synthase